MRRVGELFPSLPPAHHPKVGGRHLNLGVNLDMTTTLKIYLAPSGQWAGLVSIDGQEASRIAGCDDAQDVQETAESQGYVFDEILQGQ